MFLDLIAFLFSQSKINRVDQSDSQQSYLQLAVTNIGPKPIPIRLCSCTGPPAHPFQYPYRCKQTHGPKTTLTATDKTTLFNLIGL